jgi:hypothetical protein
MSRGSCWRCPGTDPEPSQGPGDPPLAAGDQAETAAGQRGEGFGVLRGSWHGGRMRNGWPWGRDRWRRASLVAAGVAGLAAAGWAVVAGKVGRAVQQRHGGHQCPGAAGRAARQPTRAGCPCRPEPRLGPPHRRRARLAATSAIRGPPPPVGRTARSPDRPVPSGRGAHHRPSARGRHRRAAGQSRPGPPARSASSMGLVTSTASNPARSWSPGPPHLSGRRCSPARSRSSPTAAPWPPTSSETWRTTPSCAPPAGVDVQGAWMPPAVLSRREPGTGRPAPRIAGRCRAARAGAHL